MSLKATTTKASTTNNSKDDIGTAVQLNRKHPSSSSAASSSSLSSATKIQITFQDNDNDNDNKNKTAIVRGTDSEGRQYSSIDEMWQAQGVSATNRAQTNQAWYDKAADFYETHCPPTIDGVLGGFASISDVDLQGSRQFVQDLCACHHHYTIDFSSGAAVECGAGIGRVTKGLLLDLGVTQCDLVESSARLLYEAPEYLGDDKASKCRFYHCGLQDWEPREQFYSIIWIQWVLCYLTDDDTVAFLKRCSQGLIRADKDKEDTDSNHRGGGGVIVLKENTCGDNQTFVVDNEDASVCRSLPYWLKLVEKAGLRVIMQRIQSDFPEDLFPVPMLALEPIRNTQE
jgi:protein N-terminal methyltransferase